MAPHPGLVDQWRSLVTCYNAVACALDRALHDAHGLTMSEFETLDRLVEAGCDKRRVQEIASDMYLSQSALSRTIARLEKGGLVERGMCESDRRGVFVALTDEGRERHAAALVTHRAILAEHLTPTTEQAPATAKSQASPQAQTSPEAQAAATGQESTPDQVELLA